VLQTNKKSAKILGHFLWRTFCDHPSGGDAWDDLGLAANPLNDRYFSQPDLDRGGSGRSRSRRHSEDLDPSKLPRLAHIELKS
jgi:hypothetical protein